MLIGLTGSYCSGKDTVAEYIMRKGFIHYSLSDILREELKKKKIDTTRENLIKYGTELRETKGNAALAEVALKKMTKKNDYVITSIRHPSEVDAFRINPSFYLINVDAPADLRFRRMKKRNRQGDPETFAKFRELEKLESSDNSSGQQLTECAQMASVQFINDTESIEDLHKKIDFLIDKLKKQ